jgi:DNA-binding LytR/AlgR family response regulator
MKIRCVIVDDEAPARDELRYLLSGYDDVDIVGEAESAGKAISAVESLQPDLLFLDIQMPGRDGFEVVETLARQGLVPIIVFVTAFDNYAVKAFEASAIDYILKPLSAKRLDTTLERVRNLMSDPPDVSLEARLESLLALSAHQRPAEMMKISVEKNGRMRLLSPDEIVFCSYEENRILVHTYDDILPIYGIGTLDRLEEHLCGSSFFRAHRSILVNLNLIREFSPWFNGKYNLIMNDIAGSELGVSRSRVKEFKQRLGI